MRVELFLISIILFCAISYTVGYSTIEGFARSGDYHADMFGSSECPRGGNCRKTSFDNTNTQYLLR
jgi:hypothetical protein